MPRWLLVVLCAATVLSVVGSVLIVLRSPGDPPPAARAPAALGSPVTGPGRP